MCAIHSAVLYDFQHQLMLKKGLQITCIQDTAEGVASVTALKCCDNSMVEQLQE
jgi:hypothetical protein